MASRAAWESLLLPFQVLSHDAEVAWNYGSIYRALSSAGQLIGTNDLWIAAAGLAHSMPVVTKNLDEFRRVSGLQVIAF
jgi:tRNA(fMet)-specific endonuclease VapC